MRSLCALTLVLVSGSAFGQGVAEALRAPARTFGVAELPEGYRAVSLGDSATTISPLLIMGMASGEGDPQTKLLFSLMGTTFVDPDEFAELLAGKRARLRGYALDFATTIAAAGSGGKTPTPVFEETWIEAGRVVQWSPRPALTRAALLKAFSSGPGAATGASGATLALSRVRQVAVGIMMYATDNDDRYPKADSTLAARAAVLPYLKEGSLWPLGARDRVLYNTALSGVSEVAIEQPSATLLLWQETPDADGSRAVAYADGHGETVGADEWRTLWAREGLRRSQKRAPKG